MIAATVAMRLAGAARRLSTRRPLLIRPLTSPVLPVTALAAGIWLSRDEDRAARFVAGGQALVRAVRLARCCVGIALEYRAARQWSDDDDGEEAAHREMQQVAGRAERKRKELTLNNAPAAEIAAATALARRTREEAAQAYDELMRRRLEQSATSGAAARWETLHTRCAERLLAMLLANGGLYVKLGQHLAQLDYLVPEAYTRTLGAVLFTANTASSWADAAAVIEAELGMPPEKAFASIERVPIASASLAQVHVATERGTGRKLAVKVQHAGLREACYADLAAVGLAVRCADRWFPEFCLGWVVDEIAPHLPLELDFLHEAQNLERCRRLFAASPLGRDGTVVLPDVVPSLTTTRVLTMSFEEGDSVADVACLRRRGLAPAAVARVLSEAFCTMLFQGGLVHCDPHPGNVLVRAKADGRPQLVLLDHGLYRELTPHFRLSYCRLWRALVTGDADAIRAECDGWAIGEYYPLLAAMLTARPWADITSGEVERLRERGTAQDKESIRGYAKLYMRQIAIVLGRLPREMLLLLKTNDCLRHADRRLGAPINSFLITLRFCLQTLHDDAASRLERLRLRLAIFLLRLASSGAPLRLVAKLSRVEVG